VIKLVAKPECNVIELNIHFDLPKDNNLEELRNLAVPKTSEDAIRACKRKNPPKESSFRAQNKVIEKKRTAGPNLKTKQKEGKMNEEFTHQMKNITRRESKKSLEGEDSMNNLSVPIEYANINQKSKKNPKFIIGR
jgi:hypothetical protein